MQRVRRSSAPLLLALGYVLLLFLVLLHQHPGHSFPSPSANTHVAHAAIAHPGNTGAISPVGDDCLLCNLLQLPKLGFIALLIAFLLSVCAALFAAYTPKQHATPRLIRKQPRAPPVFS